MKTVSLTEFMMLTNLYWSWFRGGIQADVELELHFQHGKVCHLIQELLIQGMLSQITVLVSTPLSITLFLQQTCLQRLHLQAWAIQAAANHYILEIMPWHLEESNRQSTIPQFPEQCAGVFLLTTIALTAPQVEKKINVPLYISQSYLPLFLPQILRSVCTN